MSAMDRDEPRREPALDRGAERGAELLRWLLDREARATRPRAELERRPEDARQLAELERFVARCRAASERFEELGPARRRSLVERVLARTTREDLSWRGDLRLFGSFVVQRLRSSPGLRLAAASLLVHLLALPLWAAWYGLARQEEGEALRIRVTPLLPETVDAEPEPRPELEAERPDSPELELELTERDLAVYVANSLAWARVHRADPPPALPDAGADASRAAELLRARASALAGGAVELAPPAKGVALAERALWAELLLDRALAERREPAALAPALEALAARRLPADAAGLFAASALARAESYGMLPAGAVDALWQARLDLAGFPHAAALTGGERDARRVAPWDERWRELVLAARDELSLSAQMVAALGG